MSNLIITDYLQFEFYKESEKFAHINLANITSEGISPIAENFQMFIGLIQDFAAYVGQTLKSPSYRETYQEFLKIDFSRVSYPDKNSFWQLLKLGGELRQIHLLESLTVEEYITHYPETGENQITCKINKNDFVLNSDTTQGQVWINDQQYFSKIPVIAWSFYIGGYQPAQKWLKDRCGRTLDFDDTLHYQKIINALSAPHRIMQEIDKVYINK